MRYRRLIIFAALAVLATAAVAYSLASFTTTSSTRIVASVEETAAEWLHLYSRSTDPAGYTTYARSRLINGGVGDYMATGQSASLSVYLGQFPDADRTFSYQAVFALVAPSAFPNTSVSKITVSATLDPDPSGAVILNKYGFDSWGRTGTSKQSVTLVPGQRYQLNVEVRSRASYIRGMTYTPHLRITVTASGYTSAVAQFNVPFTFVDAGGS